MAKDEINDKLDALAQMTANGFEQLAQMTANGFEQTATKEDLARLKDELASKIDGVGRRMDDELNKRLVIEHNIKSIKQNIGMEA